MTIHLSKDIAKAITELAESQGMSEDEVVEQIVEWYLQDNED